MEEQAQKQSIPTPIHVQKFLCSIAYPVEKPTGFPGKCVSIGLYFGGAGIR